MRLLRQLHVDVTGSLWAPLSLGCLVRLGMLMLFKWMQLHRAAD